VWLACAFGAANHNSIVLLIVLDPLFDQGEEIIMSSRLWTAGYDIFSPNEAVVVSGGPSQASAKQEDLLTSSCWWKRDIFT
jgi:Glycosyltransferase (GlcNAc)